MLPNAKDHYVVSTQSSDSHGKTQEIRKEVLRPTWLAKTRTVSFWVFLSLYIILSLFTCEGTKGYRILKDKAL